MLPSHDAEAVELIEVSQLHLMNKTRKKLREGINGPVQKMKLLRLLLQI